MYALNLRQDGRILSSTYPKYAPVGTVITESLPDGDITDYRLVDGEFLFDPLPKPEPEVQELSIWEELDAAYNTGYSKGYQEGVNTAYEQ